MTERILKESFITTEVNAFNWLVLCLMNSLTDMQLEAIFNDLYGTEFRYVIENISHLILGWFVEYLY